MNDFITQEFVRDYQNRAVAHAAAAREIASTQQVGRTARPQRGRVARGLHVLGRPFTVLHA